MTTPDRVEELLRTALTNLLRVFEDFGPGRMAPIEALLPDNSNIDEHHEVEMRLRDLRHLGVRTEAASGWRIINEDGANSVRGYLT